MKKAMAILLSIMLVLSLTLPAAAISTIAVKSITLNNSSIILKVDETSNIKATLTPANTSQTKLSYVTSNKKIATVDANGVITALHSGTTTVTVLTLNKNVSAKIQVVVQAPTTTQITFWHAMGGVNGKAIDTLVDRFNRTQERVRVTVQFQGNYDDALTKLKAAMQGKSGPDVVQIFDIGTKFMIDSGWITPMQKLLDADGSVDIKSLEPNILAYYTVDNKLYSMPFNSSTPIMYFNKNAFRQAGLDPAKPPKTFADVEEYADKLTIKNSSGKVTQYGYSMAIYGWFFEQFMAKQGYTYVNNGNGRKDNATAITWDKGDEKAAALTLLNEWKKLVDSGTAGNFGRKTDDTKNAFIAGRTAMIIESTAALGGLLSGVGDRFEIGTAFLPSLSSNDKGGVMIGGGSLWAINNENDARSKAAFEFIKYLVSPEIQVYWSQQSGYFPISKKTLDIPEMKAHLRKFPQFQTAIDQLHQTPVTEVTSGGLVGVFAEARAKVETEIEMMLQKAQTPEQAITNASKAINNAINNYNKTNK